MLVSELGLDLSGAELNLDMMQCENMSIMLADQINDHCIATGEQFDLLGVIPRGSFGPGNVVSRRLRCSALQVISASIGSYPEGSTEADELQTAQLPTAKLLEGKDLLIIDDTSDTDATLDGFRKLAYDLGARSVKAGVLVYKPKRNKSGVPADFYVVEYNGWVNFYWEKHDKAGESSVAMRKPVKQPIQ